MTGKTKLLLAGALIVTAAACFALSKMSDNSSSAVSTPSVNANTQTNVESTEDLSKNGNTSDVQRVGGPENVQDAHGPAQNSAEGVPQAATGKKNVSDPYMSTANTPH